MESESEDCHDKRAILFNLGRQDDSPCLIVLPREFMNTGAGPRHEIGEAETPRREPTVIEICDRLGD
jgi:hypothetical protein